MSEGMKCSFCGWEVSEDGTCACNDGDCKNCDFEKVLCVCGNFEARKAEDPTPKESEPTTEGEEWDYACCDGGTQDNPCGCNGVRLPPESAEPARGVEAGEPAHGIDFWDTRPEPTPEEPTTEHETEGRGDGNRSHGPARIPDEPSPVPPAPRTVDDHGGERSGEPSIEPTTEEELAKKSRVERLQKMADEATCRPKGWRPTAAGEPLAEDPSE